ncbi:hypothetical protein HWN72_30475 [Novosphingobium sp. HR1a]|nr:hypothetical protein [Novosphingobium sp. HR1a]
MIDLPAPPSKPPIEALADCGLDAQGLTVSYDESAERYYIYISTRAGARKANLQCIWDATWPEFVQLEDKQLQEDYEELSNNRFEPIAIESAKESLKNSGLLERLPSRANFTSTAEFAIAIEHLCGFATNQILQVNGDEISMVPHHGSLSDSDFERIGCVFSALTASGEGKIGIIGNAPPAISDEK